MDAYKRGLVVLVGLLAACGTVPTIKHLTSKSGVPYILVLDSNDDPCNNRGWATGCHAVFNGSHYVYYSSVAPGFVRKHEEAHVDGMRHSDWEYDEQQRANCSFITTELLPDYPLGWRICVSHQREWIYKVF